MPHPSAPTLKPLATAIALSIVLAAAPSRGGPPTVGNQAWMERMTSLLKLSPPQQAALKAFTDTSALSASLNAPSAEQVRAMSFVHQFDYWAEQMVKIQAHAQADAQALHRFYAMLTPQQRAQFDAANAAHDPSPSIAADVVAAPGLEERDYSRPAHSEPDWLVKPTADNIARVYPYAAMQARITGKVILHCMVDVDGYLGDCLVKSETPPGQGFGNAALEITGYMRMQPATNYGVPTRGEVNLPITFSLPDPD
jgi:TonB family protein